MGYGRYVIAFRVPLNDDVKLAWHWCLLAFIVDALSGECTQDNPLSAEYRPEGFLYGAYGGGQKRDRTQL